MGFRRATNPVLHFDGNDGRPLVGGKLYVYESGTSTPATTYRDRYGTLENENPVPLNERGECVVFLSDDAEYKFVLKGPLGETIIEADGI